MSIELVRANRPIDGSTLEPADGSNSGSEAAADYTKLHDLPTASALSLSLAGKADLVNSLVPTTQLPTGTTGAKGALQLGTAAGTAFDGASGASLTSKLAGLANGGWFDAQVQWLSGIVSGLTRPTPYDYAAKWPEAWEAQNVASLVSDAGLQGGAITSSAGSDLWLSPYSIQAPNTASWAIIVDCVPAHALTWYWGIKNAAGTQMILIQGANGESPAYLYANYAGKSPISVYAAGPAWDGLEHTLAIVFDVLAGTLVLYQDGVVSATITNLANIPITACHVFTQAAASYRRMLVVT
jgi:hypothetical protein